MAEQFLVPINLAGNEIRNVLLQGLASDPAVLGNGQIYYNTTSHVVRIRANSAWVSLGTGSGAWGDLSGRPAHLTGTINTADQVAVLDSGGLLPAAVMPPIALTEYKGTVADQAAMLLVTGQLGDWVIRTDDAKVYIITGPDPTLIADWTAMSYPIPSIAWGDITGKPSTFEPRKHSADIGNGAATQIDVTHNFNTRDVVISVRETAGNQPEVVCDRERTTVDVVRLTFAVAPAAASLRVVIIG